MASKGALWRTNGANAATWPEAGRSIRYTDHSASLTNPTRHLG
jgi:hypothetical protein